MKKLALMLVFTLLAGCRAMRIDGIITDAVTQKPVGTCQITLATRYAHSDPAGHFAITARRSEAREEPLNFHCVGYEPKTVNAYSFRVKRKSILLTVTPLESTTAKE